MAQIEKTAKLVRLSDTELTIANPAEDIRDRTVVDRNGEDIGEVEDLLIDAHEKRVRLLEVASGGFLGSGKTKFLLPVEAIIRISNDTVYVNQTRQYIAGAPHYDPDLIHQEAGEKGYYLWRRGKGTEGSPIHGRRPCMAGLAAAARTRDLP